MRRQAQALLNQKLAAAVVSSSMSASSSSAAAAAATVTDKEGSKGASGGGSSNSVKSEPIHVNDNANMDTISVATNDPTASAVSRLLLF